jgi:O-antigen/teichoic acid export membrane protein
MSQTEQNVLPLPAFMRMRNFVSRPFGSEAGSRVLGGSFVMLIGTAVVSVVNFGYNIAMARMLGPADFGHVASIATLLMMSSAITLSFQMVCAKFVARNEAEANKASAYHGLLKRSWLVGALFGLGLMAASWPIARLLNLPSAWLIVILGIGVLFYVPLGVHRGGMQGLCEFRKLTTNFVIEVLVKFGMAVALVYAGYGFFGAVGALMGSVIAAFIFSRVNLPAHAAPEAGYERASFREGIQAIVFFVGQVIINNIDILLVKYFFSPKDAGMYAAIALCGRVLYFAAWSIVSAMFPVSAAAKPGEEPGKVLRAPLFLVGMMVAGFVAFTSLFPNFIVEVLFGGRFTSVQHLLSLYGLATGIYALAVVLMTFEMSRKIANTGWLQLVFSGLLVVAIAMFHQDLHQVVVVQIVLMVFLLASVSFPFMRKAVRERAFMKEAA